MSRTSSGPIRNSSASTSRVASEARVGGGGSWAEPGGVRSAPRTTATSFEGAASPCRLAPATEQKYLPGPGTTRAIWALVTEGESVTAGSTYIPGAGPHLTRYSSTASPPAPGVQDSWPFSASTESRCARAGQASASRLPSRSGTIEDAVRQKRFTVTSPVMAAFINGWRPCERATGTEIWSAPGRHP